MVKGAKFRLAMVLALPLMVAVPTLLHVPDDNDRLEQIRERGTLVLLTRNGASSYFLDADGATGPEYELAREFARFIGVRIEVRVAEDFQQLSSLLKQGQGDMIAANLTRTPERELEFRFGPDYAETRTVLAVRRGAPRPRSLRDLAGQRIAVIAGSSYEQTLIEASRTLPALVWEPVAEVGIEDLLLAVDHGELDATLVDENIFAINRPFYPNVRSAFALDEPQPQAWAFQRDDDDSLVQQAEVFMRIAREDGRLADVRNRFFAEARNLDQASMLHFMRRARERLPDHLSEFQQVADRQGLDWRLLAAIGYQESHWDPEAASPTGVRGLMMLTNGTARQMGLDDRLDPRQSIDGGARYLLRVHGKIPARIPEPDRTWMALAAYNVGWGHLEDARVLTQRQGGDPDKWLDVDERLPMLTQERYYSQTKYGYARGMEAQRYVRNIRNYYEILRWMDTRSHPMLAASSPPDIIATSTAAP